MHVVDPDGLARAGAELDVDVLGQVAGLRGDRLGVEAQLQHVAGLGGVAGQLGVDRLVDERAVGQIDPLEEVGDPADAVVHERHLEDDVVTRRQHVTDPADPRANDSFRSRSGTSNTVAARPPGTAPAPPARGRGPSASASAPSRRTGSAAVPDACVDLVPQREEVRAVQPRRDLRRGQQPFRHQLIVTGGWNSVRPSRLVAV